MMSEIRQGTVETRKINDDHFGVLVFIDDRQITQPSAPLAGATLNAGIAKYSQPGRSREVESASDSNLLIQRLENVDGFIAELGLEPIR